MAKNIKKTQKIDFEFFCICKECEELENPSMTEFRLISHNNKLIIEFPCWRFRESQEKRLEEAKITFICFITNFFKYIEERRKKYLSITAKEDKICGYCLDGCNGLTREDDSVHREMNFGYGFRHLVSDFYVEIFSCCERCGKEAKYFCINCYYPLCKKCGKSKDHDAHLKKSLKSLQETTRKKLDLIKKHLVEFDSKAEKTEEKQEWIQFFNIIINLFESTCNSELNSHLPIYPLANSILSIKLSQNPTQMIDEKFQSILFFEALKQEQFQYNISSVMDNQKENGFLILGTNALSWESSILNFAIFSQEKQFKSLTNLKSPLIDQVINTSCAFKNNFYALTSKKENNVALKLLREPEYKDQDKSIEIKYKEKIDMTTICAIPEFGIILTINNNIYYYSFELEGYQNIKLKAENDKDNISIISSVVYFNKEQDINLINSLISYKELIYTNDICYLLLGQKNGCLGLVQINKKPNSGEKYLKELCDMPYSIEIKCLCKLGDEVHTGIAIGCISNYLKVAYEDNDGEIRQHRLGESEVDVAITSIVNLPSNVEILVGKDNGVISLWDISMERELNVFQTGEAILNIFPLKFENNECGYLVYSCKDKKNPEKSEKSIKYYRNNLYYFLEKEYTSKNEEEAKTNQQNQNEDNIEKP